MNVALIRKLSLAVFCIATYPAYGQVWYDWSPTVGDNWSNDNNWTSPFGPFVPDADSFEGDAARIPNIATAAVVNSIVPRVSQMDIHGSVIIQTGGVLETVHDTIGTGGLVNSGGVLSIEGNGQLVVDTLLYNRGGGNLRIVGPSASVEVGSSFYNLISGTVTASLKSNSAHGIISVAGDALLDGSLFVENGNGFGKTYGSEWTLISADRVLGNFRSIESQEPLDRGLQYRVSKSGGEARLSVENALILTVDLNEGTLGIENAIGDPISLTGYTIESADSLLRPSGWSSLANASSDWSAANPTTAALSELNLDGSLAVASGVPLDLGPAYGSLPDDLSDVAFSYTSENGEQVEGIVEYVGSLNLEAFVDPSTGEVAIGSASKFKDIEITGYSLESPSDDLLPGSWDSLAETGEAGTGWSEANPTISAISELNLENSTRFLGKSGFALGNAFRVGGEQNLTFHYTTLAGDLEEGKVVYGPIPNFEIPDSLEGDYNSDGVVNAADYVVWRRSFGSTSELAADGDGDMLVDEDDYDLWRGNFGASISDELVANNIAVPEPSTGLGALTFLLICGLAKRQYR